MQSTYTSQPPLAPLTRATPDTLKPINKLLSRMLRCLCILSSDAGCSEGETAEEFGARRVISIKWLHSVVFDTHVPRSAIHAHALDVARHRGRYKAH